ncbi:MAG: peptidylprolyl isomerase [Acidimicrobiia bacterium]
MILLRKLPALVVVFALVVGACSSAGTAEVGSVGGLTITEADLGTLFESETLPIDESLREAIFSLLAREVLVQGLEQDFGLALDEDAVEILYAEFIAQMEAAGVTPADFLGVRDASGGMVRFNAEIGVIRRQVIEARLAQSDIIELFFSDPVAYTTVCARHILVETVEEASDVRARLEAGEDFAAVATEVSLDTATPGGELGCAIANRYVPEFAETTVTAALGELTGPVETDFGFHLIVVEERTAPTEEEFRSDPGAYVTEDEANGVWGDWFNDTLRAADVTLDEKYGFWTPVGILPPDRADLVPAEE